MPSNWREIPGQSAVTFAPDGAYGQADGQNVFTHGVEIGGARSEIARSETPPPPSWSTRLAQANPRLRRSGGTDRVDLSGRAGLRTVLSNSQSATGQPESIVIFTTQLRDGNLFYAVAVAPQTDFNAYRGVFDKGDPIDSADGVTAVVSHQSSVMPVVSRKSSVSVASAGD